MSFEAVAATLHHSKASTSSKLVLVAIAYFESDQGAWMSQDTLANMTGLSPRSIRRAIVELTELREVDVIHDDGAGRGARKTNRYFVTVLCPEDCDSSFAHKRGGEIVNLATVRRRQYRTDSTPIEDKNDLNRGQIRQQ
jgi:transcriptional antiterminator